MIAARSRTQRACPVHAHEAVFLLHDLAMAPEQVGIAPCDIEGGAIVGVDEIVVGVHELLRLLERPEQRSDPPSARVHLERLVGPALAAVEILADDLRGTRERLARRLRLGDELRTLCDVLDHHHPRAVVAGDARP